MTAVQSYTPGSERISMTDAAIARTRAAVAENGAVGLRLAVKPSGCSGWKYDIELVREPAANDHRFAFGDVAVYVDRDALAMVNGTEIDYVKEGLNAFYRFNNPNVTGECGCGESFTVK